MLSRTYPVRAEASLDRPLSRWPWLVKWILAIPHYTSWRGPRPAGERRCGNTSSTGAVNSADTAGG